MHAGNGIELNRGEMKRGKKNRPAGNIFPGQIFLRGDLRAHLHLTKSRKSKRNGNASTSRLKRSQIRFKPE